MKIILFAAVAALALGMAGASHAQTTSDSKSKSLSGAAADAAVIFMPGAIPGGSAGGAAAAAAVGETFKQPQLIMNSTNAPSTGTFNDCGVAWSGAIWLISASRTSESEDCKSQRQAIFAAQFLGSKSIAFESMCAIESFRQAVERTNDPQCAATVEARRVADEKANRNRPPMAAQPMVTAPPVMAAVSQRGNFPRGEAGTVQCLNTYGVAACQ